MLTLVIDTICSLFAGFIITAVPSIRYHKRVVNELIDNKYKEISKSFSQGWEDACKYAANLTDAQMKNFRENNR